MSRPIIQISFVSPVYMAEDILEELVKEIQIVANKIDCSYEIILVDDRSPDHSWDVMRKLSSLFKEVKSIRLSRNFGQHPAIMAGLFHAKGDWIVVLDCDLQDQPKEVEKLYNKALNGFDIVQGKRTNRKDYFFKKMSSKIFSKLYYYLTDNKIDRTIANFGIYNKKVIHQVLMMNDYIKSFPLFINWVGFNATAIEVEHSERASGETSYTWSKLLSLAFNTIISFSNKPLKILVKFGLFVSVISFCMGIYTLYKYFTHQIEILGYSSLMISIWFLSGIIITIIGVVGVYVGKIFNQTKNRSSFIIDKHIDNDLR